MTITRKFRVKGSALVVGDGLRMPSGEIFVVKEIAFRSRLNRQDVMCVSQSAPMSPKARVYKFKFKPMKG